MQLTPRRERQIAHTREDILRAAARAFARRGFESATMQDIAKEAGYTVATLYSYFKGKQEIVQGLIALLAERLLRPFDTPAAPGLTFAQQLQLLLRHQLEFAERWREALMVFFTLKSSGILRKKGSRAQSPESDLYIRKLAEWIRKTAKPEEIGERDPEQIAHVLKGILHGVFLQWLHSGQREPLADQVDMVVDIFLHGVSKRASGKREMRGK